MTPPYRTWLVKVGVDPLDLNDGTNYSTDTHGLHDYPSIEPVISEGYQSGAVDMGARVVPRQFSANIHINAGETAWPIRNAAHNAARDALIAFLPPRGKLVTVRNQYLGTAGYWDILARLQQLQWQEGSADYIATFLAPDPHLICTNAQLSGTVSLPLASVGVSTSSVANPSTITTSSAHGFSTGNKVVIEGHQFAAPDINNEYTITVTGANTFTIPVNVTHAGTGGRVFKPERTFSVDVNGNSDTFPVISITPTQPKNTRWNFMRTYTVSNPANVPLRAYAVALPFDFKWHLDNGRIKGDGSDIRVVANGVMMDRWFGAFSPTVPGGVIWLELDIPPLSDVSVQVVYGFLSAPYWVWAIDGPMFDRDVSTNAAWHYRGAFMDVPGQPSTRSWQWSLHTAESQGMRGIQQHLASPWYQQTQYPTAVNAAGGEVPTAANVQGYGGLSLHHPLQISSLNFSGRVKLNPATMKLVARARYDLPNNQDDVWEWPAPIPITSIILAAPNTIVACLAPHNLSTGDTVVISGVTGNTPSTINGTWTITVTTSTSFSIPLNSSVAGSGGTFLPSYIVAASSPFNSTTVALSPAADAVTFATRSQSVHSAPAGIMGAADQVTVNIATPVTVSGNTGTGTGGEETIYMLELTIENLTTGNFLTLFGLITRVGGVWQSVTLDLVNKLLTMAGENFYYALSVDPDSYGEWLRLDPGVNSIRIRDEAVVGLDFAMSWYPRRL
jgi:hypothetical protein